MATCYYEYFGSISTFSSAIICNGSQSSHGYSSCCAAGDACLEYPFCHFTHELDDATGFYIRGCTDPTLSDSACATYCSESRVLGSIREDELTKDVTRGPERSRCRLQCL